MRFKYNGASRPFNSRGGGEKECKEERDRNQCGASLNLTRKKEQKMFFFFLKEWIKERAGSDKKREMEWDEVKGQTSEKRRVVLVVKDSDCAAQLFAFSSGPALAPKCFICSFSAKVISQRWNTDRTLICYCRRAFSLLVHTVYEK